MIIFYIVCKDSNEAKSISNSLLKKKLVACTNFFPMNSMYHWEGKIVNDNEFVLIAKTSENNKEIVEKEVLKMHSYSIPCIISFKVDANESYLNWLNKELEK